MILNSIQPEVEKVLRDNQNGFREGGSTTSHILMLKRMLEGARSKNLPAVIIVVIDFRKAFDYVDRKCLMAEDSTGLWNSPEDFGPHLSTLHKQQSPSPHCRWNDRVFRDRCRSTSRRYICILGYLFIIVHCTVHVMEKHLDSGFTVTPVKAHRIADAEFADDIALVTDTVKAAEEL